MKKALLFLVAVMAMSFVQAQDTLTGWTFVDGTATTFDANLGTTQNQGYDIRMEDSSGTKLTITLTNGAGGNGDFAATTSGWQGGAGTANWSIKFKADGYKDIKVSSKQRSGGNKPGPRDFKLQWMLSGGNWADIAGGDVTVGNDWTTGAVTELALPAAADLPGSSSVYIRWVMTSDTAIDGSLVKDDGSHKIDDIVVTGTNTAGLETVLFSNAVSTFPNPAADFIQINSVEELTSVEVVNVNGAIVRRIENVGNSYRMNTADLKPGLYVMIISKGSMRIQRKIVIQ